MDLQPFTLDAGYAFAAPHSSMLRSSIGRFALLSWYLGVTLRTLRVSCMSRCAS